MVFELSNTSRELLTFKHATSLHEEVLRSFDAAANGFFGTEFSHYVEMTQSECLKVVRTIHSLHDSLRELRDTNGALMEAKQNKSLMTLTGITFIMSFVGIVIGLFEIDFKHAPIIGMSNDFWIFSGIMAAIGVGFAAVLAHKKWL